MFECHQYITTSGRITTGGLYRNSHMDYAVGSQLQKTTCNSGGQSSAAAIPKHRYEHWVVLGFGFMASGALLCRTKWWVVWSRVLCRVGFPLWGVWVSSSLHLYRNEVWSFKSFHVLHPSRSLNPNELTGHRHLSLTRFTMILFMFVSIQDGVNINL